MPLIEKWFDELPEGDPRLKGNFLMLGYGITPDFSSIQAREPIDVAGLTGNQNADKILTADALSKNIQTNSLLSNLL